MLNGFLPSLAKISKQKAILKVGLISYNGRYTFFKLSPHSYVRLGDHVLVTPNWTIIIFAFPMAV